MKKILGAVQDLPANKNLSQSSHNLSNWAGLAVLVSWQILKGSQNFLHTWLCIINGMSKMASFLCSNFSYLFLMDQVVSQMKYPIATNSWDVTLFSQEGKSCEITPFMNRPSSNNQCLRNLSSSARSVLPRSNESLVSIATSGLTGYQSTMGPDPLYKVVYNIIIIIFPKGQLILT